MSNRIKTCSAVCVLAAVAVLVSASQAEAQGTKFTYQGRLVDNGAPASGNYDLRFSVWDSAVGGLQVGGNVVVNPVTVSSGLFTVPLDFGAGVFTGPQRWLQIESRVSGGPSYSTIATRQELTATPYAVTAGSLSGNLSAGQLTGALADSSLSANVALLNRNPQTFTGLNNFAGNIGLTDPTKTILFPATAGANAPMITMFASGTANADRMVIAHSPSFPSWGLQYQDSRDKFNFLSAGQDVLTVDLGALHVGIGTNAPAVVLDVFGTQSIGTFRDGIVNIGDSAGAHVTVDNNEISARNGTNTADLFINDFGGNVFIANSTISAVGGKVGIGTGGPANSLQVNGGILARGGPPGGFGANNNGYAFSGNSGDNDSGMFSEADDTLNFYANAIQVFNVTDSGIAFVNPTTSITFPATAGANVPMITMFASGTGNADRMVIAHSASFSNYGLQYQDSTDRFNFLGAGANAMTVDLASRRVGIGTSTPTFQLQLSTDSAGKPNGGSWANSSDQRVKKNIRPMSDGLDKLTKLRGVTFEWINPEDHANQTGTQAGFVAQEVEAVFPGWVQSVPGAEHDKALTPDGNIKSLTLPFEFDALVVEAVRQLRAEKDSQIAELQKANLELRKEIAAQKELTGRMQERFTNIEKVVSRLAAKAPATTFAVNNESSEAK